MRTPLAPAAAAALFALSITACGYTTPDPVEPQTSRQTYPEALRVICDVDRLGGIVADDPLEAGRKRNELIQTRVENPDAIYLRTMLSVKGAADQAAELRKEAKEAGIATCALADDLEKTGAGGLAP